MGQQYHTGIEDLDIQKSSSHQLLVDTSEVTSHSSWTVRTDKC